MLIKNQRVVEEEKVIEDGYYRNGDHHFKVCEGEISEIYIGKLGRSFLAVNDPLSQGRVFDATPITESEFNVALDKFLQKV